MTDAIATLLTGFGLRTQDHNLKYKFYRIAVLVMLLSCNYIRVIAIEPSSYFNLLFFYSSFSDLDINSTNSISGVFCSGIEFR